MQRRLCMAILLLEAIVLGLTTPVLITVSSVSKGTAFGIGLGLLAACVVVSGLLRFRWGFWLGWAIQVAAIALGFELTAMLVLGFIFAVLWGTACFLGAKIERERAAWMREHGDPGNADPEQADSATPGPGAGPDAR